MAYQQREMAHVPRDVNYSQRDLNYPPREPAYPQREVPYQQQPQRAYPSPNPSQRSRRSELSHSQKSVQSRASMRSTNGMPDSETRTLEAAHILDQLQKEIVFLTGGRDRQGGPLLIFPPHRDEYFMPNDITACLKYLYQIPSEESKRRGFTAIIDSRDGSWSNLVTVLGCLKQSLGDYLKQVLVLRTDGIGSRQASSSSFRRDRGPNIEPQFINLNRLYTYVDRNQLIGSMGGTLMYHHTYWLQNRLDLEKFLREARAAASHLDTSESEIGFQQRNQGPDSPISPVEALRQHQFFQDSILSVPNQVLRQGEELMKKLQQYSDVAMRGEESVTTLDNLEALKQVKRMLQYIENRVDKIRTYLENRDRALHIDVQRDSVQREIRQVVDWILGPGEKLLASQSDIGDSYETAEDLRKRLEELEIKCTDTYGHYAELRHRAEDLFDTQDQYTDDIRAQRDYMDTVCRSFASRLERRRTLLITSVRFHRLTEEFSRKLDDLLEILYNDKEADTVEAAQEALDLLKEKVDAIDLAASRAMQDGHSLLDEMSRPIKNAFGKDISPDYASQIKHINQRLEELQERKMRCDDLAEVRKLKLQQILQLRTCEKDAQQAISWIVELCDVMLKTQTHIGQTPQEIDNLQEQHKQVETTAGGTYEYGKQLLQAALVLRRSLRLELEPNTILVHRLEEAWKRFSMGNNERANRLNVASMFLAQSDKLLERVEQLMVVVAQTLTGDISVRDAIIQHGPEKREVEQEIQDTGRMGKALLERLALPVIVIDGAGIEHTVWPDSLIKELSSEDQSATDTINNRLRKMDHKISELNRYWSEMENTGQPPSVTPKISKSAAYQTMPVDKGQRSAKLTGRSQSQRGQKSQTLPGRLSQGQPGRAGNSNKQDIPKRIRKGPISKHDSLRRRTAELQQNQGQRSRPSDQADAVLTNGHSVNQEQYKPDSISAIHSQPHVSQSYYPKSEDFSRHIPSASYSYNLPSGEQSYTPPQQMEVQREPSPQPEVNYSYSAPSSAQSQPDLNRVQAEVEEQILQDVNQSVQSQYQPESLTNSMQSDLSTQYKPEVSESLKPGQDRKQNSISSESESDVSKRSTSYMIPDTLPISKSRPDISKRDVPRKVDIMPKFYMPRRAESPPKSFQELLTKFQTGETESNSVDSKNKDEVQKEISQALKSRAKYLDDELKVSDKEQVPSLKRELEECGEWIRVRVHQMEPDLMEVGSNLEEALQLQTEHDQLLSKLQAKEEEIKQLLSRADSYAAENRSEAVVYSAMSDTLAEAWRDLNDKLQYRRQLLLDSVTFHQKARNFETQMEQAQSRFASLPLATDVESARRQLHQHQEIKQDILEASKSTLDLGHALLARIKEMGMHADFTNRHATTSACYGIEHLLELLQDRRRRLEDLWEARRIRLEQSLQLFQLDQEVDKVLTWYRTTGYAQLQKTELGSSYESAKAIQAEHQRFEQQARDIQDTVLRLVRNADQLLRRTSLDAEGVRRRLQEVDTECENFMIKLDTRRKNITMAVSFFDRSETALSKLSEIEVQLNTTDLPRNSAELAERHSQLSNVIVEVSTAAETEGRLLLERVSRDDVGADGVRHRMQQLQQRCSQLESLCKARRAEAWERSQTYLHFQESYSSLQTWMTQIIQSTLSRHSDMGSTLTEAADFLQVHEQLEEDIRDKDAEVQSLSEAAMSMVKSGDQEANSAVEKVEYLQQQITRLHRVTEIRIKLCLIYVSFQRLVQQNANSMRSLEHTLRSDTENLQDLTDTAVQQTEEVWNEVESTFHDLDDKGREFLKNSSTITDDSSLQIRRTIQTVESILMDTRDHMTFLTTQWESWQTHVSTSRQFKTQWHQFIQDARKSIDRVQKLEADFFPVLAGELGSSIEAANEYQQRLDNFMPEFESIDWVMAIEKEQFEPYLSGYLGNSLEEAQQLQSKLQDFEPMAQKAQAELEEHLKTAELLSLKGDTRGQKEQIVNELVKVHQRFQARIHEYQILLKMTIQFFRNLDQLDKLIEKTEQEFLQSELPSDLSRAENMLEEHKRKKQEISHLINYTAEEGEKIVVRVRQTDAEAVAKDDVQRVLGAADEYKHRWNNTWEEQERRLRQNLQICQFNFDLRQIHSEIDELHHHLQARRGSYGNSLPAAKMTSQAFKQFEMTVELIENKIQNFTSTAELMVQDEHYDSVHIRREIDMLNTKWTTFHTSVKDYRDMLDTSIEFFKLIDESDQWMTEGNNLLVTLSQRANQCRSPEEANELIQPVNRFVEEGKPVQDDRLRQISELAVQLYGDEGPSRVHNIHVQYQDLLQNFQQADNEVTRLKHNLEQGQQPAMEEFTPMEVTVTAEAPPKPPRITQHLKNAEVMEGTKVIFECHIESEITFEVRWFKDSLPLNSPDYETRLDGNVASLTIEETFSEDTARYTVRVRNAAGEVESSAYLHVKETHQQIVPPEFAKNLKSVDALEGSPFVFECHIMGIPSPTISWYKDEINIDNSPEYVITKINGTCCLKIKKVSREHSARYTCRANNPGGEAASSARLTVIRSKSRTDQPRIDQSEPSDASAQTPVIQQQLKDIVAPEGKPIKLEIVFSASPAPQVTWYRGPEKIIQSNLYKITIETTRSVLEITEGYPEDSGDYSVVIRNPLGEARSTCTITIESFYSSAAPSTTLPSEKQPVEDVSVASLEEPVAPTFTQQLLPSREVMEGSRVRLDCVLIGNPEPEVIWFHNEKPVKESSDIQLLFEGDRCTLVIREAYLEDAGNYRVTAKNEHGTAESACRLHVEPLSELSDASISQEITAPKFTQLLRDVNTQQGQRVTLQCRVQGHPLPNVQWYKDNRHLEPSADFQVTAFADVHNLTIPEVFVEDGGNYMVKATNKAGEAKCYAKLTVKPAPPSQELKSVEVRRTTTEVTHSPPEFLKLFQDKVVRAGDKVTFECIIVGSPKPKVSWFVNGEPVVSQDYHITMEGDHYMLHIPEVFDEDAGRFSVTAENPSGKATCSGVLHVEEPMVTDVVPTVESRTFERTGRQYSSTETLTTTETRISRRSITEVQGKAYIPSMEDYSTTIVTDVKPKYDIHEIKAQERFATTITTDMQPKYQPVDLTISVPIPPKFLQALKNVTTMEGTRVTFEGVVTGKPEPHIKWYKEGKDLSEGPDFEISYKDGRVSLMIPEAFPEDTGTYTCKATNVAGQAASSAELIVRASVIPPSFTERLYDISIKEGEPVRLTVRVAGHPPPEVTWYREGQQLVSSPDFEIIQEGDIHSLCIPEVFYEDAGKFTVKASNPAGQTQVSANLVVQAASPKIEEEEQKPVSEAREMFEPSRAPGVRAAPKRPTDEAPLFKVAKIQKPAEKKPEKFTEQVQMEIVDQRPLPEFKKRIPLFGVPVEEPEMKPEKKIKTSAEMRLPKFGVPVEEQVAPPAKQTLYLKEKPRFTKPLRDTKVKEGEKVKLEVTFKGKPEPIVKWYRDDSEIQSSTDFEISYSDEGTSLSISEVFPEDEGRFKCVITNADGSATSEANLLVLPARPPVTAVKPPVSEEFVPEVTGPREERIPSPIEAVKPIFVERLQTTRLVEDTNIILESHVSGQPFPDVYWTKDGRRLFPDARHKISVDEHTGRCTLIISRCRPEDAGEYACIAVNPMGETVTSATLLPVEKKEPTAPPLPATMPPTLPFDQEVLQRAQQPRRTEKEFFIPRSSRILESNMEYRMAQKEEPEYQQVMEDEVSPRFQVSHFEDRLREEIQYRDGKVRFASETETSEYDSEVPDSRAPDSPPQIVQTMKDFHLIEGADATFVCRIIGKPRPKVAWYKDGHRVKRSNRYEIKYDRDGFCTLRIRVALPEDAGYYTVLAVNAHGKDTCSSQLIVESVGNIDATSYVQPETLDRMFRKDLVRAPSDQDVGGVFESQLKPQFKMQPSDSEVREGHTVRFDTLVTGRPAPELTWFCNDNKVHPDDHHKMVVNEDGVHSLIITKASPRDAGVYTCLATNKAGENTFSVTLRVLEREQMQPPKFVERMQNYTIREGQSVMLTARAVGTPTPMMSWQKNNKMLTPNKDYKIEIDNGRAVLYIEDAKKTDAAWFQCTAVNVAGSATTKAKLVVTPEVSKKEKKEEPVQKFVAQPRQTSPQYEIQPEGPVQEISYVKDGDSAVLRFVKEEDLSSITPGSLSSDSPDHASPYSTLPRGVKPPPPTPVCASVEASPELRRKRMPYQRLEKPEPMAVPMEIEPEEETKIPSVAEARARFDTTDAAPPKKVSKIDFKPAGPPKVPVAAKVPVEAKVPPKPVPEFIPKKTFPPVEKPVPKPEPAKPEQPVRITKKSPSPSYELQLEGPVQQISYVSDTECGYVRVLSEEELDYRRREPPTRAEPPKVPVTEEEERKVHVPSKVPPPKAPKPKKPASVQPVVKFQPEVPASLSAPETPSRTEAKVHLKVPPGVKPKPKRRAESPESHYDIQEKGYVQEIHYVSDTEMGSLRLVSYSTEEEPSRADDFWPKVEPQIPASLETKYKLFRPQKPPSPKERRRVRKTPSPPKEKVTREVDHESAVREYIRREGEAPAPEDLYHKSKQLPPRFKTEIKSLIHLKENEPIHFECKLVPIGDPHMNVEWFKDGQPLQYGHRYKPSHEFGFVSLDILYMYPEDSGVYTCRASNLYGTVETSSEVKCRGRRSIIMDTQLPGDGAIRLQEMEEVWRGHTHLEEQDIEAPKVKSPPSIDLKPEPVEVQEGFPAKFLVRVSGYPRPRVNWFVNGSLIVSTTRHKVTYDGMMHYLEIPRARDTDTGQVRVVARNSEGEAEASTSLNVLPHDDWRSKLRQAPKGELQIELDRRQKIELRRPKVTEYKQIEKVGDREVTIIQKDRETIITEQQYITTHRELRPVKQPEEREMPARVVRPDRPEIQLEIQQAKMVPIIPEPVKPVKGEPAVSEQQVLLDRREPPVFTKPLRPARITEGKPVQAVEMEVHFKGYPPPLITWYRDNFEIRPSHDFQIVTTETTSKLTIPEVFPEDTGMFTVKAYNMYGMVQCKAKLTVVEEEEPTKDIPPEFRNLIRDNQALEGEPATFDCKVAGHPKPKVHWEKDGKPMDESPRMKFIHEDDNYTLLIYEVKPEDAGDYACVAINDVGKATCTAKLCVEVPIQSPEPMEPQEIEPKVSPPECVQEPQNLVTDEGEPVTFTCRIRGSPPPVVTWYRNNQIVKPSKYFHMESTPDGIHSLSILEAFPEDTGTYKCVARNKAGETTVTCHLKVHGLESEPEQVSPKPQEKPPQIMKPITNTLVVEGSPAKFVAEYSGEPQPQVTWLRNALQALHETRDIKIETTRTSTTLTIRQAFPEDSGLITCRLKNRFGMTECSAELYVQAPFIYYNSSENSLIGIKSV